VERRICIQRVFAYFNYSYAASIHKAQSTINHVFIIEDDILEVKLTTTKEKLQSINVGISRASYRAYIYNKIYKVDNSNLDKNYSMYHERGYLIFKLEHLDRYAIVKEPCNDCKKQPKLAMDDLYRQQSQVDPKSKYL
jgi:hypothetical protein